MPPADPTSGSASRDGSVRVTILIPVFNDWAVAGHLCGQLDAECAAEPSVEVSILLVDDGSPDGVVGWSLPSLGKIRQVDVLRLRRNLGHQRAIAVGLCHLADHDTFDVVVVMDGDGEDKPSDAVALMRHARAQPSLIWFAERRKRIESLSFRVGYWCYRLLHRTLTGVAVRVGNFSAVPAARLSKLTHMSELWNHYAGAIFRSRMPYATIPTIRGRRLGGRSSMSLPALVAHGVAGLASFHDIVATRILLLNLAAAVVVVAAVLAVVAIRLGTSLAVPGWATVALGVLFLFLTQVVAVSFGLLFTLMANRSNPTVVPARDYTPYVAERTVLWSRPHPADRA